MLHLSVGLILKPPPCPKRAKKHSLFLWNVAFKEILMFCLPLHDWESYAMYLFVNQKCNMRNTTLSALEQANFWWIFKKYPIINCNLHSSTMEMQNIKFHKPWNMLSNLDQEVCWNFKEQKRKKGNRFWPRVNNGWHHFWRQ